MNEDNTIKLLILEILIDIVKDLADAVEKHPNWRNDPLWMSVVIGEEYGEFQKALLESTLEEAKKEARHVAVTVLRTLVALDNCQEFFSKPRQE